MTVDLTAPGCEAMNASPLVIKNVKDYFHIHTYGGLSKFFDGLRESRLYGTRCVNAECGEDRIWLPPRLHCPDCLQEMEWADAPREGVIYTHSTVQYPGSSFKLSTPCPLISVELEGVCTRMMSYLMEGTPEIGLPVKAVFRTENPTNTILDLAWVPAQ